MNPAALLAILQFVVALLGNPQAYNMTPQQAVSFSNSTVSLVVQSLGEPSSTAPVVTLQTSTSTDTPVVINVAQPVYPVITEPMLGAAPAPVHTQKSLEMLLGNTGGFGMGYGVDIPWGITESSTIFHFFTGNFDSVVVTVDGQDYPVSMRQHGWNYEGEVGVKTQPGQAYSVRIDRGNDFAISTGTIQ